MAKHSLMTTPGKSPLKAVLPPQFDADVVESFFNSTPVENNSHAISVLADLATRRGQSNEEVVILDDGDAGAKPDFGGGKGGGNTKDGTKGGGKKKDSTTTEPVEEPLDPVSPTPEPEPEPEPYPEPTLDPSGSDFTSGLDTPDGFNIDIEYQGTWTAEQRAALEAAAEQISDIILGDLPSVNGIDDVRITANMGTIDGTGGTWGTGGYDSLRSDTKLASTGHIKIDIADAGTAQSYGLFEDLVFHELLHALGFGTAWSTMGLIDSYGDDLRFNGTAATDVYNTQYAAIADADSFSLNGVPVETDGGSASAGKHWDEETFNDDIMSTQLDFTNTISDLSIAALEDMGYQTILVDEFAFV